MKRGKQTNLLLDEQFITDTDFSNRKVITKNYKGKRRNMKKRARIFKLTRNIVIQDIPIGFNTTNFVGSDFPYYDSLNSDLRGGTFFCCAHSKETNHTRGRIFCHGSDRNSWTISNSFLCLWQH